MEDDIPPQFAAFKLSKGTSLHRQLLLMLKNEIESGTLERGGLFPSEESLCERFSLSRVTVRRTLGDLAAMGLIERKPGRGTFVRKELPPPRLIPTLGVIDSLKNTEMKTQVRVLAVSHAVPPREIGMALNVQPGEEAVNAVRLRSCDGSPVMLTDVWAPLAFEACITPEALGKMAFYEILAANGVTYGRAVQEITATTADFRNADLLAVENGAPLLKMRRVMYDSQEQPVIYSTVYLPSDASRVLMDISGQAVNTMAAGQVVFDTRRGGPQA